MTTAPYKCSSAAFYAVARTGWASYQQQHSHFAAFRGYYDAAFGNAALAAIDAAEHLPDIQARYANTEVYRTELKQLANDCLAHWQRLKRYASSSFPPAALKARLQEAGALRNRKARNHNWEELRMMNVSATQFIATHQAALLAGNNMPPIFEAKYTTANAAFAAKLEQFIRSEQQAIVETKLKITANNAVYHSLINMFKDGQEIFRGQDAIRRQFVFNKVLALIVQNHPSPQNNTASETISPEAAPLQ